MKTYKVHENIIEFWLSEAYLAFYQTSMMKFSFKNSFGPAAIIIFA